MNNHHAKCEMAGNQEETTEEKKKKKKTSAAIFRISLTYTQSQQLTDPEYNVFLDENTFFVVTILQVLQIIAIPH